MPNRITREHRIHTGDVDSDDKRSPFQRDRDRILYARELRRLGGITQVVHADEGHSYHNRLTHSLKVAQVGRRLAEYLQQDHDDRTLDRAGGLDEDVVEAAALAHDLGHPPFGHAAEDFLQEELDDIGLIGGFEGNPQSFRIVNEISVHSTEYRGLDLTYATLNAMLKYPWHRRAIDDRDKWGYYETEEEIFNQVRQLPTPGPDEDAKSLEATIMDWADDITYAIHDLIDFYQADLIPLEQLIKDTSERQQVIDGFMDDASDVSPDWNAESFLESNIRKIGDVASSGDNPLVSRFDPTPVNIGSVNYLSSRLVERYLGLDQDVEVRVDPTINGGLYITDELISEVKLLKYITKHYVFEDPTLLAQQEGHKEVIERVFNLLYDASGEKSELNDLIPEPFHSRLKTDVYSTNLPRTTKREVRGRMVSDIIACLSEDQILQISERISGHSAGSITDRLFY